MDPIRPLRIAHVTSYQVPEYGYEEIQLATAQSSIGHDVTIITSNYLHPAGLYSVLRRRFPSRQIAPRDETVDGVRVLRLRSHELGRRVWIHGLEESLLRLDPDVIHFHNLLQFHPARAAVLRVLNGCRAAIVVDDHMHFGFMRRSPAGRLFYLAYRTIAQPILSRYVERYCAIGQETVEYLRTACGVKNRIDIMPLGVATRAFAPNSEARQLARGRLGLRPSDLVLIYTGKVIPEKGVHLVVEAASHLKGSGRRIYVLIVGDTDERYASHLTALAAEQHVALHLQPSVEYNSLPAWYAAADIGVWPRQESMAVYEAMAAGLPVVVSARSGLAAEVTPGGGLTYEPETGFALAACLRALLDPSVRNRVAHAARQFAEAEFDWYSCARRYVALYRDAIAARASR